jgi:hypothetical protein
MFMRIDLSIGFSAVAPPQAYDIRTPPPSPFPPVKASTRRSGAMRPAVEHCRLAVEIDPGDSDCAKRGLENSKAKLKEPEEDR